MLDSLGSESMITLIVRDGYTPVRGPTQATDHPI
jgi:hypothetical protein